jgi:hypothetical protein
MPGAAGIFAEFNIAYPVQVVLHRPVVSAEVEELIRRCLLKRR